jgi:hypothetical protein
MMMVMMMMATAAIMRKRTKIIMTQTLKFAWSPYSTSSWKKTNFYMKINN